MDFLLQIITNRILVVGVASWFLAQVFKTISNFILTKKFSIERLFGDGGMPSGHTATVVSVAVAAGLYEGFDSAVFAIAMILAIVVMHDAMNVRYQAGKQAELLNVMAEIKLQDKGYRDMQITIIPTVPAESIIGVRTPALRKMAKELSKSDDVLEFLGELPHKYFEENQLHAFILSGMKDAKSAFELVDKFLPYVDNWATCDQMSPKVFAKEKALLLEYIDRWIKSDMTYVKRFAIGMLMEHFLDEDFKTSYLTKVSRIRSDEYYVNMMTAWYFATALAKQYDAALPFIEKQKLDRWTHNKSIQKAVESYRITPEQKEYLKTLRRKA